MIKQILTIFLLSCLPAFLPAQDSLKNPVPANDSTNVAVANQAQGTNTRSPDKKRIWLVAGGHAAVWAISYVALNKAWYADYPKEDFHFFNDWEEWNQMDKAGHVWTAYQLSRFSTEAWRWTGLKKSTSIWIGSASAVAYQSIIEIQDGFSSQWGFSWGDMTANIVGAAAFAAQELTWGDQRIQIKMSYWPYEYPDDLIERRNQLFGTGSLERILKDYNSQTYWASANLKSFLPNSNLPKWLNISFGYASELMLGGRENTWTDKDGVYHDRTDIERKRRFFLAPDIDLTKIKTKSKFIRGLLFTLNAVKFPAPALELDSKGTFKVHAIYF